MRDEFTAHADVSKTELNARIDIATAKLEAQLEGLRAGQKLQSWMIGTSLALVLSLFVKMLSA